MPLPVEVLLCVLLVVLILAALRLYVMLGDIKATLANVEQSRQEITVLTRKLDLLMTDEIAPTLQVARQTLANVEITTKALADTTLAARRITAKSEGIAQAAQLLLLGGSVATKALRGRAAPDRKKPAAKKNSLASMGLSLLALLPKRKS